MYAMNGRSTSNFTEWPGSRSSDLAVATIADAAAASLPEHRLIKS